MENDRVGLAHAQCASHQLSAESIAKDLQTSCGLQIRKITVCRELHKWVYMAEQLHPGPTSLIAMQSVGCSGI
ncbi:unnamed protein product [Staurois parvus]|uniref:Transposase n=1 Tax=Staurois parvus TaxID=386267 RepID=A0ABN9EB20_9NEOB|nr:unnamed protein product [Staurois parvus]